MIIEKQKCIPSMQAIWQIVEKRWDIVKERFPQRWFIIISLHCRHPMTDWVLETAESFWIGQCTQWQMAAHWLSRGVRLGKGVG